MLKNRFLTPAFVLMLVGCGYVGSTKDAESTFARGISNEDLLEDREICDYIEWSDFTKSKFEFVEYRCFIEDADDYLEDVKEAKLKFAQSKYDEKLSIAERNYKLAKELNENRKKEFKELEEKKIAYMKKHDLTEDDISSNGYIKNYELRDLISSARTAKKRIKTKEQIKNSFESSKASAETMKKSLEGPPELYKVDDAYESITWKIINGEPEYEGSKIVLLRSGEVAKEQRIAQTAHYKIISNEKLANAKEHIGLRQALISHGLMNR